MKNFYEYLERVKTERMLYSLLESVEDREALEALLEDFTVVNRNDKVIVYPKEIEQKKLGVWQAEFEAKELVSKDIEVIFDGKNNIGYETTMNVFDAIEQVKNHGQYKDKTPISKKDIENLKQHYNVREFSKNDRFETIAAGLGTKANLNIKEHPFSDLTDPKKGIRISVNNGKPSYIKKSSFGLKKDLIPDEDTKKDMEVVS
jgi:hypothetical protein